MLKTVNIYLNKLHSVANFSTSFDSSKYPLKGVKILDLSRIIAGPFCSQVLSDLGADVIKVEKPDSGDESRNWGPPFLKNSKTSVYFLACNRNKKSICINLKTGKDVIYDLARSSDVLIENYVPGKLDKMGLGYEDLKKISPSLIYCSVTGFGSYGPYKTRAGYDVIAASIGGLINITGSKSAPAKVGVAMTDIATGLFAHGAILAALLHREKTGLGQKIDVDLLSTQIACLINVGVNYLNANVDASRWGTEHVSIVPYASFKTKDSFFTIGAGSDEQFKELCDILNIPDVYKDSKFAKNNQRVKFRLELNEILSNIFVKETNAHWNSVFATANFPFGPVNNMKEVFNDPHVKEIEIVKSLEHPEAGEVKVFGPPVVFSDSLNTARTPPPMLGEHTDEILRDVLGYSEAKIANLKMKKIVQ